MFPDHPDIARALRTGHYRVEEPWPVCDCCRQRVQTDRCFCWQGNIICEDCIDDNSRRTEDVADELYL